MKRSDRYAVLTFGLVLVGGFACGAPAGAGTSSPGAADESEAGAAEAGAAQGEVADEGDEPPAGEGPGGEKKADAPAPVLFEDESGVYGYRDAAGEVVIPPTFAMAMPFTDAVAAVVTDGGWAFIDRSGKTLATAFVFDNGADAFAEGRARITEEKVKGERTYGFIASSGEIVVAPTWSWALPYADGRAAVCQGCVREQDGEHFTMKGGTWGYVDLEGKVVIPPSFEEAGPFEKGRATVKRGGKSLEIGPDGNEL